MQDFGTEFWKMDEEIHMEHMTKVITSLHITSALMTILLDVMKNTKAQKFRALVSMYIVANRGDVTRLSKSLTTDFSSLIWMYHLYLSVIYDLLVFISTKVVIEWLIQVASDVHVWQQCFFRVLVIIVYVHFLPKMWVCILKFAREVHWIIISYIRKVIYKVTYIHIKLV